jgi:hypothetical protein
MVLFYADVLGMKARWRRGVPTIRAAYGHLEELVVETFVETATGGAAQGGVQSDAVAITFDIAESALIFGRHLFVKAFERSSDAQRFWLRGVIVQCSASGLDLAQESGIAGAGAGVRSRQFCDELLEAINVEQSFKGPRLLIAEALVTRGLQDHVALPLGSQFIVPLKHLKHSVYPSQSWQDVLYLFPDTLNDETMRRRGYEVGQRQRWASEATTAGSSDEFEHISHLALVWTQCDALYRDKATRAPHLIWPPQGVT